MKLPKGLTRFTLFHRSLLMTAALVAILIVAFAIVLADVRHMTATIEGQSAYVSSQNKAIKQQNALVHKQQEKLKLQDMTFAAYGLYSKYLYWRLNSVSAGDDQSVSEGDKDEKALREKIKQISALSPDLGDAANAVTLYLDDFNKDIKQAYDLVKEGAPPNQIAGPMGDAQSQAVAMNDMFDAILSQAGKATSATTEGVLAMGKKVAGAAQQVQDSSGSVLQKGVSLQHRVMVILGISIVVSLVIGWLLARSISRPLQRLARVIVDIEETNDISKRVEYQGRNEIGDIAHAFNSMLEKFSGIVADLSSAATRLSESADASATASATTENSVQQLRSETDLVATASNEMAVTVKGINDHTREAVNQARTAAEACRTGQEIIADTMKAIESLAERIFESAESVRKLAGNADNIGSVLDVIRGIAEQTNLLALNAAIEAARAGEAGRGFAVVADEVRTLAKRTGDSTDEIQNMIERLQSDTQQVVTTMEGSREQASDTLGAAGKTTSAIENILGSVTAINSTNEQISHATEEQTGAAESIDKSIVNISQLTGDVSAAAGQTASASEQLRSMVEELRRLVVLFRY